MMRNSMIRNSLLAIAALLAAPALAAVPGTVATFDSGPDDFVGSTVSTVQIHLGDDGNPGGHLVIRKITDPGFDIGTRNSVWPEFLGDYAAAGVTGAGVDLNVFLDLDEAMLRFRRDVFENGWNYDFGAIAANPGVWVSYDVLFNPAWDDATALANGWAQEAGAPSFAALMASVGWLEVRVGNEGSAIVGVDNVRLIPEPATLGLLAVGAVALIRRRVA